MIPDLARRFNVQSGLSDHTIGSTASIIATVLGGTVIEKHFIIDRSIGGPDASFSMNEQEFKEMVKAVRDTEKAIGKVDYSLTDKQKSNRVFSRSLYVVEDIKAGEIITEKNVRSIRPGYGLHPKFLNDILGRKVARNIAKGEPIQLNDFN
jgi:pseudaminic acid synthase